MRTITFSVPDLDENRDVMDLANVLNALIGIECVSLSPGDMVVSATYDPDFISEETVKNTIVKSGYPLSKDGAS